MQYYIYLTKLVEAKVVEFDEADVLDDDTKEHQGYTATTFKKLSKSCKKLRDYLFDKDGNVYRKRLRLLLVGPDEMPGSFGGTGNCPTTMRSVFEHIISGDIWNNGLWRNSLSGGLWTIQTPNERKDIEGIFRYNNMNVDYGEDENMAYWLVNKLKAETCPFCNRMYTKTLMKNSDGGGIRPELDHFYPKSKYPYLAVSLFNLIPICSYCNKQKSNHAEMYTRSRKYRYSIIYPYDEAFYDERGERRASFRLIPGRQNKKCLNYYQTMIGESTDFSVEIRPTKHSESVEFEIPCGVLTKTDIETRFRVKTVSGKDNESEEVDFWKRVGDSINMLRLEKLYNTHEQEIAALLKNRYIYNKSGVKMILRNVFKKENPTLSEYVIDSLIRNTLYFGFLSEEQWGCNQFTQMKTDLRYRQLNEADFRGLDLSGADFTQSSLINTDLSFTNLDGAEFSGANVTDAIWDEYEHMEKCAFIDDSVAVGTSSGRVLTYNISSKQKRIAELANDMIRAITADRLGVYTAAQDGWVGYISRDGELKNAFISNSGLQSITSGGTGSVYVGADVDGIFRYNWKTGGRQQIITDYVEKSQIADIHYYSNCNERYIAYITGKKRLVLVKLEGLDQGKLVRDVVLNGRGNSFGDICFADDNLIYSVTGSGVYSLPVQEIELFTNEQYLLNSVHRIYNCINPVELCWADDSRQVIIIEKACRRLDVITCVSLERPEMVQQKEISWIHGQKNYSVRADSISGFSASSDGKFIALSGEKLIVLKREEDDDYYYQIVDKPIEAKISCTNTKFRGCIGMNTYQKEKFLKRNAIME